MDHRPIGIDDQCNLTSASNKRRIKFMFNVLKYVKGYKLGLGDKYKLTYC